jgi:hypothetical protein
MASRSWGGWNLVCRVRGRVAMFRRGKLGGGEASCKGTSRVNPTRRERASTRSEPPTAWWSTAANHAARTIHTSRRLVAVREPNRFARRNAQRDNSLWIVRPDGNGLRELRIEGSPCGGPTPALPPEDASILGGRGRHKIIFGLVTPDGFGGEIENVCIANADGTGLTQVTRGREDETPDRGRSR